jgi:hypothetical protein
MVRPPYLVRPGIRLPVRNDPASDAAPQTPASSSCQCPTVFAEEPAQINFAAVHQRPKVDQPRCYPFSSTQVFRSSIYSCRRVISVQFLRPGPICRGTGIAVRARRVDLRCGPATPSFAHFRILLHDVTDDSADQGSAPFASSIVKYFRFRAAIADLPALPGGRGYWGGVLERTWLPLHPTGSYRAFDSATPSG